MSDHGLMRLALDEARLAMVEGEVPVGAILVDAEGAVIGRGRNRVMMLHDPSAHAEILALRDGAMHLGNYRLENTTLYVTLEPCPMCAGALVHARVRRLVFATRDFRTGAAGSVCNLLCGHPFNHQVLVDEGLLQAEASALLLDFFRKRRP